MWLTPHQLRLHSYLFKPVSFGGLLTTRFDSSVLNFAYLMTTNPTSSRNCHQMMPDTTTTTFVLQTTTTTTVVLQPFVWDYPGEPVQEETFTHPPSWSSSNLYHILSSTTIHSILPVQIVCLAMFLHNLSTFVWSASWSGALHLSYSIHFFDQSLSSFRNTCPYHRNLFCCSINIISSIPSFLSTPYLELCLSP